MDLIIGNGLIGRHLYYLLRDNAILTTRKEVDLSKDNWDIPKCKTAFICAAVTSTEYCESHREESQLVNITNTVKLAERLKPARVVWLSSERVYDGLVPFRKVTDEVCPTTEYGRQKAITEGLLLDLGVTVIRLSKILGWDMPLFEEWMESLSIGKVIHPYSNFSMSPLPVSFAVECISKIARLEEGLYQLSAREDLGYDRIAYYLANYMGVDINLVQPVLASKGRPNSTLDSNNIEREVGVNIPSAWETIHNWCRDFRRA